MEEQTKSPVDEGAAEGARLDASSRTPDDYPVHTEIPLRWSDQDIYGHVNNVIHYAMADTAVNGWLIDASGVDIRRLPAVGVVVETGCTYVAELHFPQTLTLGIRLTRRGRTSVVYEIGIFTSDQALAAVVRFVHVYVDQVSRRPAAIPPEIETALAQLSEPDTA